MALNPDYTQNPSRSPGVQNGVLEAGRNIASLSETWSLAEAVRKVEFKRLRYLIASAAIRSVTNASITSPAFMSP